MTLMASREREWRGDLFRIKHHSGDSGSVQYQDFSASIRQLEILSLIAGRGGYNRRSVARQLAITDTTVKNHLKNLKERNKKRRGLPYDEIVPTLSLVGEAYRLGLLFPISILGLRSTIDDLRREK